MHQPVVKDDFINQYFQDGNHPEEFSGDDNRAHASRPTLSPEGQALVNALSGRIKGSCLDNCVIPKEAHPHVPHMIGTVKEIGDGSIPNGANKWRDQFYEVRKFFKMNKTIRDTIIKAVVSLLAVGAAGYMIQGFVSRIQGG
jgi:hypothetical protein